MFANMFQNVFHNPYSTHYHQVPNPRSNATFDIPQGLAPGKQVFISGLPLPSCDRFKIDLETRSGVALHINPRFSGYGANSVVRNSELAGSWGAEETSGPFPFQHGQNFDIAITVEQDKYKVLINGAHAFDFNHRTQPTEVVRLGIQGDLQIHRIVFSGVDPSIAQHGSHPSNVPLNVTNINVPYAAPISRGPEPGRMIQISGLVPSNAGRFVVNLQNGPAQEPNEIPFHLSVRFNDPSNPHTPVVVRTNRSYGNWGNEERDGPSPFVRGGHFDLLILIEHSEFKVAVNGVHFTSFRHRNPLQEANHVGISGDVQIHSVRQF